MTAALGHRRPSPRWAAALEMESCGDGSQLIAAMGESGDALGEAAAPRRKVLTAAALREVFHTQTHTFPDGTPSSRGDVHRLAPVPKSQES